MSSKSKQKAQDTKQQLSQGSGTVGSGKKDCPLVKHFFAVKVQDKDGQPVTDIRPRVWLNDGSVVDAPLDGEGKYNTGKILVSTDDCKVGFPTLYDCDWWPDGADASGFSVNQQLTIADGQCVVSLAKTKGFKDYHDIWDRSKNADLKSRHKNPNSLSIGDVLWAPDKKTKKVPKAVDKEWIFIIEVFKPPKLRIVLVDKKAQPLEGWTWDLTSPVAKNGTTGADGLIEVDKLDATATAGQLKVTIKPPKTKPAGPPVVAGPDPDPLPYPIKIKAADFKDKKPDKPDDADAVDFKLMIGSLPAHKDVQGARARLHNLGYSCTRSSGDKSTTRAVKLYQKVFLDQKNPTGTVTDIQDDLETRHSKA